MPHNQFPSTQRRKAWGRITILFALIALALTALPATAFAGTDTAGNVLATDSDSNPSGVEGDLYWAGQSLDLDDASIDHDIIAAGESLSIRDCTVGGQLFLCGRRDGCPARLCQVGGARGRYRDYRRHRRWRC